MTQPNPRTRAGLIQKILALLDSDHAGEVQAAARALTRVLRNGPPEVAGDARLSPYGEIEACLAYATDAVASLSQEIEQLRAENASLRASVRWPHVSVH